MNLRTIKVWVIYVPRHREIIAWYRLKKDVPKLGRGEVLVQLKGFYLPPRGPGGRNEA